MNYGELRAAIARANVTNRRVAAELELSDQAVYNKLNGLSEFKNSEIKRISSMLKLSMDDVNHIFFDNDVN